MKIRLSLVMVLTLLVYLLPASAVFAQTSEIHYHGIIESRPTSGLVGEWHVSGHVIHVTSATLINQEHGQAVVAATVAVYGIPQQEVMIANSVEILTSAPTVTFQGVVESLPASGLAGDWHISGHTVHVTSAT